MLRTGQARSGPSAAGKTETSGTSVPDGGVRHERRIIGAARPIVLRPRMTHHPYVYPRTYGALSLLVRTPPFPFPFVVTLRVINRKFGTSRVGWRHSILMPS